MFKNSVFEYIVLLQVPNSTSIQCKGSGILQKKKKNVIDLKVIVVVDQKCRVYCVKFNELEILLFDVLKILKKKKKERYQHFIIRLMARCLNT